MRLRFLMPLMLLGISMSTFAAPAQTAVLDVPGMTCPLCPITVKTALLRLPGVQAVTPDLATHTVRVVYDSAKTSTAILLKTSADAGYPATIEPGAKP